MDPNKFRLAVLGRSNGNRASPEFIRLQNMISLHHPGAQPAPGMVLVAGWVNEPAELTQFVSFLHQSCASVSVVTDALIYPTSIKPQLLEIYGRFHDEQIHLVKVGSVAARLNKLGYNRAENSAALCLVIGSGENKLILVVRRKTRPLGLALPSGFWKIGAEDLRKCARREGFEETGVVVEESWLQTIDVYSDPEMDPRDYVVETIFGCHITDEDTISRMESQICPQESEVEEARFMTLAEFMDGPVAFARHLDATQKFVAGLP